MEKNQSTSQSTALTPDSKMLRSALAQASKQANRMAEAFGLKVPTTTIEKIKAK